jgi:HK97 family phage portal protein
MSIWPFKSKKESPPAGNHLGSLVDNYELLQENNALKKELQQAQRVQNFGDSFSITDSSRWQEMLGTGMHAAGQVVNHITAFRASAVFACVRLISSAICCAPVKIYKRDSELRVLAPRHPLAEVLRLYPNRFMTAATFWKAFMQDKLLMGNGYAHIVRGRNGAPLALIPLKAWNVMVYWAWELGLDKEPGVERNRLFYGCVFDDGRYKIFDQSDIIHVPNLGWNGRVGLSTLQAMAQAVGVALGADSSTASFFANGLQTQSVISFPNNVDKDAMERLKQHLEEKYTGSRNHHKPLILFADAKVSSLAMTAADAQLLESRKFSVIDICRFFGVHPVMVGENEKTSSFGGGVEQMGRWFNTLTLNEHFTAIEQELERKLFTDGYFAEFDETAITRGDLQARADYYKAALGSIQQPGWMSPNEVRAEEGLAPKAGEENEELFKPATGAPDAQPEEGGSDEDPANAAAAR